MYDKSVFINCPFDNLYADMLQAITFAVCYAGFIPRSALEETNSGDERLAKIMKIIEQSCYSIHDISRVEVAGPDDLPRFNMPFECGIVFGAWKWGTGKHKKKQVLILDSEKYRYQKTMSDVAGKDPACHNNDPYEAISCVRRFLNAKDGGTFLPGASVFIEDYKKFQSHLPSLLASTKLSMDEVREMEYWKDYVAVVKTWIDARATTPAK